MRIFFMLVLTVTLCFTSSLASAASFSFFNVIGTWDEKITEIFIPSVPLTIFADQTSFNLFAPNFLASDGGRADYLGPSRPIPADTQFGFRNEIASSSGFARAFLTINGISGFAGGLGGLFSDFDFSLVVGTAHTPVQPGGDLITHGVPVSLTGFTVLCDLTIINPVTNPCPFSFISGQGSADITYTAFSGGFFVSDVHAVFTPEPETWLLLVSGLIVVLVRRLLQPSKDAFRVSSFCPVQAVLVLR